MKSKRKRPAKTGSAPDTNVQVMPKFMKKYAGRGHEMIGPLDAAWLGHHDNVNPDTLLASRGYDPLSPLDYILLGLIAGHRKDARPQAHLAEARRAIGAGKPDDPRNKDDHKILLDMGVMYLKELARVPDGNFPLQPIALQCFNRARERAGKAEGGTPDSQVKRLCAKFKSDKDLILARVTMDKNPERIRTLQKICDVLQSMNELGIKTSWAHVTPDEVPIGR